MGYVYILSNPSMPNLLKIGCTDRSSAERIIELSSATGVPTPFDLEFEIKFIDHVEGEGAIHKELEPFRVSGSKEFFRVPIEIARRSVRVQWENQVLKQFVNLDGDSIQEFCKKLLSGHRDAYETLVQNLVVNSDSLIPSENHIARKFSSWRTDSIVRLCLKILAWHPTARGELKARLIKDLSV